MKTKSTNRVVSLLLALFMLLTCVPLTFMATKTTASAAGTAHVLDAASFATVAKPGLEGQQLKSADNYFTVYCSKDTGVNDQTGKTFDDGFEGAKRLNFGKTNLETPTDVIEFTTSGAAKIKVWWIKNKEARQIAIYDASGNAVFTSAEAGGDNSLHITSCEVSAAGKYRLGNVGGGNYIFKIEVTEEAAAEAKEYTLDASADLPNKNNKGDIPEGTTFKVADFFTIYCGADARFDTNGKDFADGYHGSQRINFNGPVDGKTPKNAIGFKTDGPAEVKVWWVANDAGREITIVDGSGATVDATSLNAAKGAVEISTLKVPAAGTYFLGAAPKANYIFKVVVKTGGGSVQRADWSKVADPVITAATQEIGADGKPTDNIKVTVNAVVGNDGGDAVKIIATDKDGKETSKNSLKEGASQDILVPASASGTYTLKAVLSREGETDKVSATKTASFTLTLKIPTMSSVTSKGSGTMEVIWNAVPEATSYNVYRDGTKVGTSNTTTFMDKGLTVGNKYNYTVSAVRGSEESAQSDAQTGTATKDAQQTWGFVFYGTSTSAAKNYFKGDLNNDGKVQVVSNGGGGKFQEGSNDGIAFYYTAIPTNLNFTLRAKIHIDTWTLSSGQEGTGVMALDSLPSSPNSSAVHWSNSYRAGAQRFAYRYDPEKGIVTDGGVKYQMNIGIGIQNKLGITKDNVATIYDKGSAGIVEFNELPLETIPADKGLSADIGGTFATIGNCTNPETFKNPAAAEITDMIIELQRNNTGYFLSYYTPDGKLVKTQKFYEPKALDQLDPDYVYVGFASARNMEATYSDVTLTTIDPKDDKPAEERPVTKLEPKVTIGSASIANSTNYKLLVKANVVGTATVKVGGNTVASGVKIDGTSEYVSINTAIAAGANKVEVVFTPDKNQKLPAYTVLSSTDPVTASVNVQYDTKYAALSEIYIAPNGTKDGKGDKASPLDIYTAVNVAAPGQTIIMTEGTYKLSDQLVIERGIDGTYSKQIKMIADPDAKTRPVIDLQKKTGIVAVGNYWYFKGFDVTGSSDGTPAILVAGSYCTYEDINAYTNGDCGIYIRSKGNSADPKSLWPKYNVILNCSAYDNADATGENADGFAAKFTVGVGNVFDGCVAYNNCDDGWDLYARGMSIESVMIKNCVAYNNGHNISGKIKGNGNGFKLGGENMAGGHKIINSVAFNNDSNGITCNSCPDIKIINCTSYNNGANNITVYSNATNTDFEIIGSISFRDSKSTYKDADSLSPKGTQDAAKIHQATDYFWDGSKSVNTAGKEITADMFVSLEFKGVNRKADGSIDLQGFLELNDKAPKDTGAREGGADAYPNPSTGVDFGFIVAIIALVGAAAAVLFIKRRRA